MLQLVWLINFFFARFVSIKKNVKINKKFVALQIFRFENVWKPLFFIQFLKHQFYQSIFFEHIEKRNNTHFFQYPLESLTGYEKEVWRKRNFYLARDDQKIEQLIKMCSVYVRFKKRLNIVFVVQIYLHFSTCVYVFFLFRSLLMINHACSFDNSFAENLISRVYHKMCIIF